jgi:hypothetical protein
MGNWMTVNIKGTCSSEDVEILREALDTGKDYENFHCLVCGGACGLPNWAKEDIDVTGNLAERDYDYEDIAKQLEELGKITPSLVVDIHCGGDYESKECVKTVRLHKNGKTEIVAPLQEKIPEINPVQMADNIRKQLNQL